MSPIAVAIVAISAVAVIGRLLGSIPYRGICIGSAGVLFAGILLGHLGVHINQDISEFAKEFGLVLFVFTIGLQLGPGIMQLWRQQGLVLNAMAISIVLQGVGFVLLLGWIFDLSIFASAGIFSGATTNTPSLGAAQQAAATISPASPNESGSLAAAYAVAYPGGVIGIISSMLILRWVLRIDVGEEENKLKIADHSDQTPIHRRCILIDNAHLAGIAFGKIPGLEETGTQISRIKRAGEDVVHAANKLTILQPGDLIQVVGTEEGLDQLQPIIGARSDADLMVTQGDADFRRIVVTETAVLNKPIRDLSLDYRYGVTVTRIRRAGVEMPARYSSRLHYGDILHIVGDKESLNRVTEVLGNSVKALDETQFMPVFLGIAIGVIIGMIPITIPGVPFPVKLGLAGGPLIAAIVFSLVGSIGKLVWYIPYSANLALREFGITLFLACVGLKAGHSFFGIAFTSQGVTWMLTGIFVTMIPLLTTGLAARYLGKLNYLTICGVTAGSMTDPPALAFASSISETEACSTAYAAVYPLTMILRIIAAQAIVYSLA